MKTHHRLLLSIQEAAEALGIGRSKLYQLVARGELPLVHLGKRALIPRPALERYVEQLLEEAEHTRGATS